MRKIVFIVVFFAFVISINAQKFTYNKVVSGVNVLKINGTISFTDSLIYITGKDFETKMPVKVTLKNDLITQYKTKITKDTYSDDIRLSLTKDAMSKNGGYVFIMEVKDNFSGSYQATTYFLLPAKN